MYNEYGVYSAPYIIPRAVGSYTGFPTIVPDLVVGGGPFPARNPLLQHHGLHSFAGTEHGISDAFHYPLTSPAYTTYILRKPEVRRAPVTATIWDRIRAVTPRSTPVLSQSR